MNGKRAKYLRKLAQTVTVGEPDVAYVTSGYMRPVQLKTTCTRAAYQKMKRVYVRGTK
jgi:hypothetical protein